MTININKAFGIFPDALLVHEKRAEVIASNIANQDTPGYIPKDVDYQSALKSISESGEMIEGNTPSFEQKMNIAMENIKYRNVLQSSIDSNSVDPQMENSAYMENSMRYMAALEFVSGKVKGLLSAIRGE